MKLLKELEKDKKDKILGLLLSALSLLLFISLISYDFSEDHGKIQTALSTGDYGAIFTGLNNQGGVVGALIAFALYMMFGYCSIFIPVFLLGWGLNRFFGKSSFVLRRWSLIVGGFVLAFMTLVSLPHGLDRFSDLGVTFGGAVGHFLAHVLLTLFGPVFSYTLVISLIVMGMVLVIPSVFRKWAGDIVSSVSGSATRISTWIKSIRRTKDKLVEETPAPVKKEGFLAGLVRIRRKREDKAVSEQSSVRIEGQTVTDERRVKQPRKMEGESPDEEKIVAARRKKGDYQLPPLDLLDDPQEDLPLPDRPSYRETAEALRHTLLTFGVEIDSGEVNIFPGPVITRFEFKPASGIKVSQITNLADDLALAMQAERIRIVAPIPGKPAVGVEIPNRVKRGINIKEIISSSKYMESESKLILGLGKTISGEPFVADLARMPHLLIAGSTGSGKSVCLNCIITSLVYRLHPSEVRFILIDPKRLELSVYNGLPHMEKPVVTEMRDAEKLLGDVVLEMEERYRRLARAGVRNIDDFNVREKEKLPYLIIIVDELADLMISGLNRVESLITRLAQMARAVGIHLILATQRPSVDVITGLIKANFSTRIAFQVATKVDSRTILDANGAEKLLGRGDMLFSSPGMPEPIRIHGAYISGDETERLVEFVCQQEFRIRPIEILGKSSKESIPGFDPATDPLFRESVELVIRHKQGSVSLLQRRLGVGYQRAARLIDQLENAGIVGPYDGSKAREVLVSESYLESDEFKN
jgi:S-DNA-T family DNA segregation ATPase FtsK/SpoIIIE